MKIISKNGSVCSRSKMSPAAGILIALFGGFLVTGSARADTVLTPGTQSATPDNFTSQLSGLTLVSSISGNFSSVTYTGTYLAAVYSGAQNNGIAGFCAGLTNCLTFVYQIDDMAGNSNGMGGFYQGLVTNLSASSFAGFSTDVGYSTALVGTQPSTSTSGFIGGFSSGTNNSPATVDHDSAPGSGVEWDFNTNITPGQRSDILVVETNATVSQSGLFSGLGNAATTATA